MTHYFNELFHLKTFQIPFGMLMCAVVLSTFSILIFNNGGFAMLLFFIALFSSLGTGITSLLTFTSDLTISSNVRLFQYIIEYRPNIDPHAWNIITSSINLYLFEQGEWSTPYRFYDGQSTYAYFKGMILKQTSSKHHNSQIEGREGDIEMNLINGNNTSAINSVIRKYYEFPPLTDDFEFKKLQEKATEAYIKSLDEYWRAQFPEANQYFP
ncbi:hypothetical protein KAFR_0C00130 [Kazachstania africana CBS 2517]|uniref:Uncharacterized protein n=1 Tax=Kazachstania africana (strain ATCC 22294 / BCRC 22015 / CBS 2517 / CECT 1963 / NBRC 1671 / NRRL Y-8276) TaxID=1071382 RepID=H2ARK9_KAZAF|nr:hypothetical protein KAFR_0C00130 [Kazachstania africana CBS 2517]CCF57009.1 hypothetical protein KAFR_0C00130 [Kazachstania africana CBS 2517]